MKVKLFALNVFIVTFSISWKLVLNQFNGGYQELSGGSGSCWDGQPHIGNCYYGGWCPPRYTCSAGNVCCSLEGSYPYCPYGGYASRSSCSDFDPCGPDEYCLRYLQNEFCCPKSPLTQPKCPDGWPMRSLCTEGNCQQGMFCYQNNICCPEYGIPCPDSNAEFRSCGQGCELSCETKSSFLPCSSTTACVPGCYCKTGHVKQMQLQDSRCVLESQCPTFL